MKKTFIFAFLFMFVFAGQVQAQTGEKLFAAEDIVVVFEGEFAEELEIFEEDFEDFEREEEEAKKRIFETVNLIIDMVEDGFSREAIIDKMFEMHEEEMQRHRAEHEVHREEMKQRMQEHRKMMKDQQVEFNRRPIPDQRLRQLGQDEALREDSLRDHKEEFDAAGSPRFFPHRERDFEKFEREIEFKDEFDIRGHDRFDERSFRHEIKDEYIEQTREEDRGFFKNFFQPEDNHSFDGQHMRMNASLLGVQIDPTGFGGGFLNAGEDDDMLELVDIDASNVQWETRREWIEDPSEPEGGYWDDRQVWINPCYFICIYEEGRQLHLLCEDWSDSWYGDEDDPNYDPGCPDSISRSGVDGRITYPQGSTLEIIPGPRAWVMKDPSLLDYLNSIFRRF